MFIVRKLLLSFLCAVSIAGSAAASANIETWDTDTSGWLIRDFFGGTEYGSLDWVSTLGGYSGVLRDTGGASDNNRIDYIYTQGPGLAGNMDYTIGGLSVVFDFYNQSAVPAQLDIYLMSDLGGNEYEWHLDVTSQVTASGWSQISGRLDFSDGWYNIDDGRTTAAQFSADLADVDEIGIMITYLDGVGGQIYALDNFDVIPEPETWAFLGIAFLSIGYSFRDRLDKSIAMAKAWIKG